MARPSSCFSRCKCKRRFTCIEDKRLLFCSEFYLKPALNIVWPLGRVLSSQGWEHSQAESRKTFIIAQVRSDTDLNSISRGVPGESGPRFLT